jgi:MtaA/CmuA family methyltransferase
MNGYDRILAAMNGKNPDRTPVMLHNFLMAAKEYGITMDQYRNNPRLIAESFMLAVDRYKYDGILVDIDTVTLAGAVGVPVDFPLLFPARSHIGNLINIEDVVHLKPVNIENYKYIQVWLEAVRLLVEQYKNEIYVRGNCDQAPFSLASMMRGAQNWMLDLMMSTDEYLEILLEYCTDITIQFIRLMAQTGCDMVSNGDSPAGPEMISPEMYLKYAMPYEKRVVEAAHAVGLPYTLHICGNTEVILNHMLLTGADALELDFKTDIFKIYNKLHEQTTFIGNIDPSAVLCLGTPALVRSKTQELLAVYKDSSRLIVNAGCAIPAETPSVNLKAMINTIRNFSN